MLHAKKNPFLSFAVSCKSFWIESELEKCRAIKIHYSAVRSGGKLPKFMLSMGKLPVAVSREYF